MAHPKYFYINTRLCGWIRDTFDPVVILKLNSLKTYFSQATWITVDFCPFKSGKVHHCKTFCSSHACKFGSERSLDYPHFRNPTGMVCYGKTLTLLTVRLQP